MVGWFWNYLATLRQADLARLLHFITGCSRLPAQGFRALQSSDGHYRRFNLHSVSRSLAVYPRAPTCFNRLDLPLYGSEEELVAHMSVLAGMETAGMAFYME